MPLGCVPLQGPGAASWGLLGASGAGLLRLLVVLPVLAWGVHGLLIRGPGGGHRLGCAGGGLQGWGWWCWPCCWLPGGHWLYEVL